MPIFSGSDVMKQYIAQSSQEHRNRETLFRRDWIVITEPDSTKHLSMSFRLSTHLILPSTAHVTVSICILVLHNMLIIFREETCRAHFRDHLIIFNVSTFTILLWQKNLLLSSFLKIQTGSWGTGEKRLSSWNYLALQYPTDFDNVKTPNMLEQFCECH